MAVTLNANTSTGFIATSDTSGVLQLQTGGTTAVTVDASQNVGIGTSSPQSSLHVKGTLSGAPTATGVQIGINSGYAGIEMSNTTGGWIDFNKGDGTDFQGRVLYDNASNLMQFYTNSAERMRLDASGNLLVGVTSTTQSHKFANKTSGAWTTQFVSEFSTANQNYGITCHYTQSAPNNSTSQFFEGQDNVGSKVVLRSNGGIANYSANNVNLSDRREKTNFAPAKSYLDTICAIPVQTFNFIDQNMEEDGGLTLGVVAQDVQAVAPEMVMESNWGTKEEPKMRLSIYQTDLQYALMKCIQEQQAIITSLTDRITALEGTTP